MHKLIATIAIAALTSVTLAGSALAMPGGGVGDQMASPSDKIAAPQGGSPPAKAVGGVGGFKVGGGAGGFATGPGETFYPNGTSGNARRDCLFAGGTPKGGVGADGDVLWLCL